MGGAATTRIPMSHRVLSSRYNCGMDNDSGDQPAVHLSGSIFGFLEEETAVLSSLEAGRNFDMERKIEDDEEVVNPKNVEENMTFWENQFQNLHTILSRTTTLESRIKNITNEVIKELEVTGNVCSCLKPVFGGCRSCRMTTICRGLQNYGLSSGICKSKWKDSLDIPSGEHTYIDVVIFSSCNKKEVRVIIDLDFRGHFEMKKGSNEYNRLVSMLPDIFVGKIEKLMTIIKILSPAAEKCMKEKKMHLGPWRKQKYMRAKWLRVTERTTTVDLINQLTVDSYSTQSVKTRLMSSLTMDLLDQLPNMPLHEATVVKVL